MLTSANIRSGCRRLRVSNVVYFETTELWRRCSFRCLCCRLQTSFRGQESRRENRIAPTIESDETR
jgi:hypothetical protein